MDLDRRTFLKMGTAGIVGVAFAPLVGGCEEYLVSPIGESGAPFITPIDAFFVQNGGQGSIAQWTRPDLTESTWQMSIEGFANGDVASALTVTYNDLVAAAAAGNEITMLKTIQCVLESPLRLTPTGFMGNAYWTGVPLKYFTDRAGISASVKRLLFYGADGFTNNLPIARVNDTAAGLLPPLLVYRMNGVPLTADHGHPVRLIVQEGFGFKNVKWVTKVVATRFDTEFGTYQDQGFVDDGVMRVNSRSTALREGVSLPSGTVDILGYAVSGYAPITRVEIGIDGGTFADAELVPLVELRNEAPLPDMIEQIRTGAAFPYPAVWARWRFRWQATRGRHTVAVRASDAAGNVQPDADGNVFDGKTGVMTYTVNVT